MELRERLWFRLAEPVHKTDTAIVLYDPFPYLARTQPTVWVGRVLQVAFTLEKMLVVSIDWPRVTVVRGYLGTAPEASHVDDWIRATNDPPPKGAL